MSHAAQRRPDLARIQGIESGLASRHAHTHQVERGREHIGMGLFSQTDVPQT
jgi:hypothetical protein